MGKPKICIGENKGADQLRSNCEADHAFVFVQIVQFLFHLNLKFQASSNLLCLTTLLVFPRGSSNMYSHFFFLFH